MKLLSKEYYKSEELRQFREVYLYLAESVRPMFSATEWRLIREYVLKGIKSGAYNRDIHGISLLLKNVQTCQVLHEKVGLKQPSILTVLLYPLVATGSIEIAEIRSKFGEDTAHLISCMSKVMELYSQHGSIMDENFRRLLISLAEDVRVVICLIADRYVLMKMLNHTDETEYRKHVTQECKCLYIPIAHRLGLYSIKSELEDMTVKYDDRETFNMIESQLQQTKAARENYIQSFIKPLEQRIRETTDISFSIKGRTKSISSILHKLNAHNTTLDKIYDIFAIRIIVDAPLEKEKSLCWQIYSIVTDMYVPNPKRMKDWISIPKSNGYESLHVTVHGPENRWVEVQIRSKRMDEVAEKGLAAHWKYKGIKSEGAADQVMASIREALEHNSSPTELMKDFSMDLYQEEIFVFTPNGEIRKLPKGATVLDFAFHIHSRIGMTCVGAKVGNRNVKINYQLKSGDTVEIITNPQQTPKQDWLGIVVTSKARNRIMQVIKETSKPFNGQNQSEWSPEYGYGKIQAYEGLKKVLALPSAIATIRNTSTPVTLLKQDKEWKILFNSGENFANINVCGINGTIVKQKNLKNIHRGQEEILSFNDLEKGFYIVSIKTKNHLTSQKIIVK